MKKINITIDRCEKCPYCRVNIRYGINFADVEYSCGAEARVLDEFKIESKEDSNTVSVLIPEWCPLPDKLSIWKRIHLFFINLSIHANEIKQQ